MKRYLLFWFHEFYPCGGWNDLEGIFESMEEVWGFIGKSSHMAGDWQLVDGQTGMVIEHRKPVPAWWDNIG